jgi:hypothetical protein
MSFVPKAEDDTDIAAEMQRACELRGDTYSSSEIWGLLGRGVAEIEQLRANLNAAEAIGTVKIERLEAQRDELLAALPPSPKRRGAITIMGKLNWTEEPYQWNSPPYTIVLRDGGYDVWLGKIAVMGHAIGFAKTLEGAKALTEAHDKVLGPNRYT